LVSSNDPDALLAVVPICSTPAALRDMFVSRLAVESELLLVKAKLPEDAVATPSVLPAPACQPNEQCFWLVNPDSEHEKTVDSINTVKSKGPLPRRIWDAVATPTFGVTSVGLVART
jgi:hypothetical protein